MMPEWQPNQAGTEEVVPPRLPAAAAPPRPGLEEGGLCGEARLLARLQLLNQIAQAAASHLDLGRILAVALRELDRHLPLHVSAVWLVDDGAAETPTATEPGVIALVLAAASPAAGGLGLAHGLRLALPQTPFAACFGEGQALYADLREDAAAGRLAPAGLADVGLSLERWLAARGATSCFAVPLRGGDRTVGVLQSVCTRPSGFTTEQIQLLYLVADLLGPAISNCQLFGRLSKAYEELRVAQTQLIQAEKMRALGELAGGMAHEFNNSLCGVLGFLELALTDEALAGGSRGYLQSARTCALDAAHTVRRVQDFARLGHSDPTVAGAAPPLVDLNELVRQGAELIRHKWEGLPQARGAPVQVEVGTEAEAWVAGNAVELREVFTNLAFNAVDAMPQGGRLTVRTWSTPEHVFLAVQDTGVGISEPVRQRLFEPFFSTKGERGNGLGLSITFAIVQRHGGDIGVESHPGRGSTFTVRLPARPPAVAPGEAGQGPPPAEAGRGLRILVVEDEESIRRFLELGLTGLGYRPRLAADAEEGLAALTEERFDVVLTDLGLPGLSGEAVARAVARRAPGTPVVLLTGWAEQLKADATIPDGVTRILSKPVTLQDLAATLAEVTA